MTAGLAVQATRGLDAYPIGPWRGLGVLAAYAGATVLIGGILFRLRDAGMVLHGNRWTAVDHQDPLDASMQAWRSFRGRARHRFV
jgi:hypothetical protein